MRALDFVKRRCGLVILLFVAGYSLVYAIAFVRLYFLEHPYRVASSWIFDNVPAGSRLVGPHWDDKVPVSLPGKNTSVYVMEGRDNELPVYEPDMPSIIEGLSRRISNADYIMFPTPRTPDSIPRIPKEYPNTTALLRLLWGEKLGFQLVKTFKNRPSFLGITFNDDLADESFSVYDHPKVAVFKNVEKLSTEEILARIKDVGAYEPLPTMDEMLLMDTGGWQPTPRWWNPIWTWFAYVLALLGWVSLCVWVCVSQVLCKFPDRGLGLGPIVGLVMCTGVSVALATLGLVPFTHSGTWFVVVAFTGVAGARLCLRPRLRKSVLEGLSGHGVCVLVAIVGGSVIAYVMKSSDPSFFGVGEQIEAIYLSYLAHSSASIPNDILNPGSLLSPRLFDGVLFGWLLKLLGADVRTAVSTVSVVLGAILGGFLYTIFLLFLKRPKKGLIAALVALIPATYLVHVARDAALRTVAPLEFAALLEDPKYAGLILWSRRSIQGAPCVASVCDEGALRIAPVVMGLPACEGVLSQQESSQQLCSSDDPGATFKQMMRLGIDLFVTPAAQAVNGEALRQRIEQFSQRPDLFTKLFDDGNVVLFLPVYSGYVATPPARASS